MTTQAAIPRTHHARKLLLRVTDPSGASTDVPLAASRMVIGRGEDADVLLDSPKVSRRHAELVKDPFERWWVRDLGSRNGCRVNGAKLTESILQPGDGLEIGGFGLTLWAPASAMEGGTAHSTVYVPTNETVTQISRLREYETPRIGAAHLSAVGDFGHQLNVTPDQGERLRRLCRLMITPEFHGQVAMVLRVGRTAPGRPSVLSGPESSATWHEQTPPISQRVLRTLCDAPEPLLATNAAAGPMGGHVELSVSPDVLAMTVMALPIQFDEQVVDVLYIVLTPEYGHGDWLALASLAVGHYRQAEAVWANVAKIRDYAAVARELELAQEIQMRLIPRDIRIEGLGVAIGFRPCHWVGGDYADVVPMNDGRVLLVVADVCGKGLAAALITASLHTMIHANVKAGLSPKATAEALNEYLDNFLGNGTFVTMVCLAIDPKTGVFESVNAGHPPGIIVSPRGGLREMASCVNPPLGIGAPIVSEEGGTLYPGELLTLFTDGLTECMNAQEKMLGMEGLGQQLRFLYGGNARQPLSHLVPRMTEYLDEYQQGEMANDDRTFMFVRVESEESP